LPRDHDVVFYRVNHVEIPPHGITGFDSGDAYFGLQHEVMSTAIRSQRAPGSRTAEVIVCDIILQGPHQHPSYAASDGDEF
jgi:hypothetical protein